MGAIWRDPICQTKWSTRDPVFTAQKLYPAAMTEWIEEMSERTLSNSLHQKAALLATSVLAVNVRLNFCSRRIGESRLGPLISLPDRRILHTRDFQSSQLNNHI